MEEAAWRSLVERTRSMLRALAVAEPPATISYRALRDELGVPLDSGEGQDLSALLRAVSIAEDDAGRGLVSALVVRPSGRPGGGWFRLAAERGRDVTDPDRAWLAELARVRAAPRTTL